MPGGPRWRSGSDVPFLIILALIGGLYVLLVAGMLIADVTSTRWPVLQKLLGSPNIQYSIKLSLISCSITAILSVWVAVPLGYLLSRYDFRGKTLLDVLLDLPIVLPPMVIGVSLLILFSTPAGNAFEEFFPVPYEVPAVILAQYAVSAAFAVRTMRVTFDQISPRQEQVALTLGCSRAQAFWLVVLPQARRGIYTAGTLAWARALGEFGPVLIFASATPKKTEVLPTSIYLEWQNGNLEGALGVSLLMLVAAMVVLVLVRVYGTERAMKWRCRR